MAILDKNRAHGRQFPLVAHQDFDLSELTSGSAIAAVKVPAGARVIGGGVMIDTAFDSATSDVMDVGDGDDDDRYSATPIDVSAAGYTALDITGYKYTTTDFIDLIWTGAGTAATEGAGRLIVEYIIDNRTNEVMPDYD